ncbi:MAG: ChaN family lipoprotein [Myxococcales bacterium]|nr:ChaN family lipoprotein [Myxococcales bacterium]
MTLADAALPFAIVDGHTGRAVTPEAFWAALTAARAVCAGEEHPNPHHHWAQLTIVEHLVAAPGRRALGLEMIQTPFQGVVDDFATGVIDEPTFLTRVGWSDRWGYPWSLYQPIIAAATGHHWGVRALNAPAELVKRVSKVGVAGLTPAEQAQLPELVLDDARHRAWFDALMADMGEHGGANMPTPDNMYAAQVLWDESMAAGAKAWLDGADAIVIIAGNGHCHDSAIVGRLRRRGVTDAVSVRPIIDDGDGNVAAALAEGGVDYLWIMTRAAAATPAAATPAAAP